MKQSARTVWRNKEASQAGQPDGMADRQDGLPVHRKLVIDTRPKSSGSVKALLVPTGKCVRENGTQVGLADIVVVIAREEVEKLASLVFRQPVHCELVRVPVVQKVPPLSLVAKVVQRQPNADEVIAACRKPRLPAESLVSVLAKAHMHSKATQPPTSDTLGLPLRAPPDQPPYRRNWRLQHPASPELPGRRTSIGR